MVCFSVKTADEIEATDAKLHKRGCQPFCGFSAQDESKRRFFTVPTLLTGPHYPESGAVCFARALEERGPSDSGDRVPIGKWLAFSQYGL